MTSALKIYNPGAKPYGMLSNNARSLMSICSDSSNVTGKKCKYTVWNSVSQYVYSNMLDNTYYRDLVKTTGEGDYYDAFFKYKIKSEEDVISMAIKEALEVKFENKDLLNILLSTGNSNLFYVSDNSFLGTGTDGKGKNIYGRLLMDYRNKYQESTLKEQEQQTRMNDLYRAFAVYFYLQKLIRQNGDDLSAYIGANPQDIFELKSMGDIIKISDKTSPGAIDRIILDSGRKVVFDTYLSKDPELRPLLEISLTNPYVIVLYLRKKYLRQVKASKELIKMNKVFDLYINYVLKTQYPNIPQDQYPNVRNEQFSAITGDQYADMQKDIYALRNKLPAPLYEQIQKFIVDIREPTEQDVLFAENFNMNLFVIPPEPEKKDTAEKKNVEIHQGKPSDNYIDDLQYVKSKSIQALSPVFYTGMLHIGNFDYPTVTHYILACLLASIRSVGSLKDAQNYLVKDSSKTRWNKENIPSNWRNYKALYDRYLDLMIETEDRNLKTLVKKALDKKFEDRILQDILLSTGDRELIWNDKKDGVLGIGEYGKGENYTGKYLETLRADISHKQREDKIKRISVENIADIIDSDTFIRLWVKKRVKELINTAKKVRSYTREKYNFNVPFNSQFVKLASQTLYQPCDGIKKYKEYSTVPESFVFMVQEIIPNSRDSAQIIGYLWEYIVSILMVIVSSINNPTLYTIQSVILKLENLVSNQQSNIKILDNPQDTCTLSAIVNILLNLQKYSDKASVFTSGKGYIIEGKELIDVDKQYFNPSIKETDVKLAVSLILNMNYASVDLKSAPVMETEDDFARDEDTYRDSKIAEPEKEGTFYDDVQQFLEQNADLQGFVEKEDDLESEPSEYDYEEESEPEDNDKKEGEYEDQGDGDLKSQVIEYIQDKFKANIPNIADFIILGLRYVRGHKMPVKIKNNRISFFSGC